MNKPLFLRLFVFAFLFLILLTASFNGVLKVFSQTADVGVEVGDWAKYGEIEIKWKPIEPGAEPDSELVKLNNTVWFKNIVVRIYSTVVTFNRILKFKDGTQETMVVWVDLNTGATNDTEKPSVLIPAGLNQYDMFYPYSKAPLWVNKTVRRTYLGVEREVNRLHIVKVSGEDQSQIFSIDYYWDKETGILVERSGFYVDPKGNLTWSDRIIDTNLWEKKNDTAAPQDATNNFSSLMLGVATITVISIAAVWLFRPKKKRKFAARRTRVPHSKSFRSHV
jgi:hypothetical protein